MAAIPAPSPVAASAPAPAAAAAPAPRSRGSTARPHRPGQAAVQTLRRLLPWALPIALLVLWEAASRLSWLSTRVLPEPAAVLQAFVTLARSGELWQHLGVSTGRALSGLAIGGGLGLVLGLLTGSLRWAETLLDTTLQMVRNIPPLALIPLVILWFGIDETAKLFESPTVHHFAESHRPLPADKEAAARIVQEIKAFVQSGCATATAVDVL